MLRNSKMFNKQIIWQQMWFGPKIILKTTWNSNFIQFGFKHYSRECSNNGWKSLFGLNNPKVTGGDLEEVFLEFEIDFYLKEGALFLILASTSPSPWPVSPLVIISFSRAFICPRPTFYLILCLPWIGVIRPSRRRSPSPASIWGYLRPTLASTSPSRSDNFAAGPKLTPDARSWSIR